MGSECAFLQVNIGMAATDLAKRSLALSLFTALAGDLPVSVSFGLLGGGIGQAEYLSAIRN